MTTGGLSGPCRVADTKGCRATVWGRNPGGPLVSWFRSGGNEAAM